MTNTADRDALRRAAQDIIEADERCAIGCAPDGEPLARLVLAHLDDDRPVWSDAYVLAWHDANGGGHAIQCSEERIRGAVEERDTRPMTPIDPASVATLVIGLDGEGEDFDHHTGVRLPRRLHRAVSHRRSAGRPAKIESIGFGGLGPGEHPTATLTLRAE